MASMRTSNSNSVPSEITDHIIDYLSIDIPSLRACSLTCKLFLTRSRYHRLKTVFLEPRTAASLFKLLNDTPSVSFCIQKLVLCRNRIPRPRPPITFRKELGWVSSVAHILSHLTRLEVEGFSVAGALAKILTNNFKNVGQLTLIRCSFPAMDHLFYLYSSFPNLNDLRMSDTFLKPTLGLPGAEETGPEDNVKSVAVDNLAPPLLTTLAFPSRINFVQDSVEMRFIAWIMKQSLHKNLRTLKMYDVSPTERTLIQQLITKLGPGLQRLSIGLSEMFDQGEFSRTTTAAENLTESPQVPWARYWIYLRVQASKISACVP